jgi:hypothetical protein
MCAAAALAQHVLTLMQQPTPGADVRRVAEFMSGQTAVADALALEWFGMHGDDAVPMSQTEASRLSGSLYELEAHTVHSPRQPCTLFSPWCVHCTCA